MRHWVVTIHPRDGVIDICDTEDNELKCYYNQIYSYMKIGAYLQPDSQTEPMEVGRITASIDGVEVIGSQSMDNIDFSIVIEFQYHHPDAQPFRKMVELFMSDDIFHLGDKLTITRQRSLALSGIGQAAGMEHPALQWQGTIDAITISPILHEGLKADIYGAYGADLNETILVHRWNEESREA